MKKIFLVLCLIGLSLTTFSQFKITASKENLEVESIDTIDFILFKCDNAKLDTVYGIPKKTIVKGKFTIEPLGDDKIKVTNSLVEDKNKAKFFKYCSQSKFFIDPAEGVCPANEQEKSTIPTLNGFPFPPTFNYPVDADNDNTENLVNIVIDANANAASNNGVVKNGQSKTKKLKSGSFLNIYIQNLNLNNYTNITFESTSSNFSYSKGITDLWNSIVNEAAEENADSSDVELTSTGDKKNSSEKQSIQQKLEIAANSLNEIDSLQSKDWQAIVEYKSILLTYLESNKEKILLDSLTMFSISEIISYTPKSVKINELPIQIEEADEITYTIKLTDSKGSTIDIPYNFYTFNGITFNIGPMVYVTSLIDDDIYEETIGNEKFARKDSTVKVRMGFGLAAEMSIRNKINFGRSESGFVRPLLNIGVFMPYDDEPSPQLGLGGGLNIGNQKFVASISGGMALGSVDRLQERYEDVDISNLSATDELTKNTVRIGWQVGIGLSYNFEMSKSKK